PRQEFHLLIDLQVVGVRPRTECPATALYQRRFHAAPTGAAGPFLAEGLLGGAGYLVFLLGLVRALALMGEVRLDSQVDCMFMRGDGKYIIRQLDAASGFFPFTIENVNLHGR